MLPFLSLHVKSPFENHERRPRATYDLRDFQTESFLASYLVYIFFLFQWSGVGGAKKDYHRSFRYKVVDSLRVVVLRRIDFKMQRDEFTCSETT